MGGEFSGAVTGLMNTAAYSGGFLSSVIYGQLAEAYGYTIPFLPMVALAAMSAALALVVDAERRVVPAGLVP
jgi:sugar phosphate permease